MLQGHANLVQPFEQACAAEGLDFEAGVKAIAARDLALVQIDREVEMAGGISCLQRGDLARVQGQRQHAVLHTVVGENIVEGWRDDGAEAVVTQGPHGVLAGRAAAKIFPGEKNAGAGIMRRVQGKLQIGLAFVVKAPVIEEEVAVAGAPNALEELLGDDLVGINIVAIQQGDNSGVLSEAIHHQSLYCQWRMSTKCPATAAAAAIAGLTRCVRPPAPWRPSKLRLLVEAQRSPGCKRSAFMPRHMEQ